MKTKRIINGAFWGAIGLAACIGTCIVWHKNGCQIESLIAAIAYYTGAPYENKWNITSDAKGHTLNVSIRKSKRGYNIAIVGEDGSGSHFGLSEHPHKYYDYEF